MPLWPVFPLTAGGPVRTRCVRLCMGHGIALTCSSIILEAPANHSSLFPLKPHWQRPTSSQLLAQRLHAQSYRCSLWLSELPSTIRSSCQFDMWYKSALQCRGISSLYSLDGNSWYCGLCRFPSVGLTWRHSKLASCKRGLCYFIDFIEREFIIDILLLFFFFLHLLK